MVNAFKLFLLIGGRREEVLSLKWNDIIQGNNGLLFFQFRNLKVEWLGSKNDDKETLNFFNPFLDWSYIHWEIFF